MREKLKDEADKVEGIKRAVSRYEKQSFVFTNLYAVKKQATEGSTECVALNESSP
jgi:hypothetical protein